MPKQTLLSEDEARPIFEPYAPGMIDDLHSSFDWVQQILDQDSERRATFDTSTQAAMVFNRYASIAGRRFSADNKATLRKSGRMLRIFLGNGRAAVRFKKLRKDRYGRIRSSNVKTAAQNMIYYQLGFDGMQDAKPTEFTFGYTTDVTNTEVTGLYITCPVSYSTNKYVIPLEGGEESRLPFAHPTSPNNSSDRATVIITSKTKKAKRG